MKTPLFKRSTKRFTMDMDADLHERLKLYAVNHGLQMGVIIHNLLTTFLAEQERRLGR